MFFLIEHLPDQMLQHFYQKLCIAEDRHYLFYLDHSKAFAQQHAVDWQARFNLIAETEGQILSEPGNKIRFHS